MFDLHLGDCLATLRGMPDASVDAVVTDPPYGLSFMGKRWDYDVPSVEVWAECLRVLKPGGHLLAFAGTRTQHRMAVRIEDAGFEIRDLIAWVYGSGFPKSLDVSKAIDKIDAAEAQERRRLAFTAWVRSQGVTSRQIDEATGTNMGGHYTTGASQPAIMTREHLEACRHLFRDVPEWVEREADQRTVESENFKRREVVGHHEKNAPGNEMRVQMLGHERDEPKPITIAHTPAARQWQGWGTALKPALEPITVARKPLVGTVAENVLKWGTGAINIDECRVPNQGGGGSVSQEKSGRGAHRDELRRVRKADGAVEVTGGEGKAADDVRPGVQIEGNDGRRESAVEERGLDGRPGGLPLPPRGRFERRGQNAFDEPKGPAGFGASACNGANRREAAEADGNGAPHQRGEGGQQAGEPAFDELVGALERAPATGARGCGVEVGSGAFESASGRWPANLIHDGSDEPTGLLGEAARFFYCAKASKADRDAGLEGFATLAKGSLNMRSDAHAERNGNTPQPRANTHPTVKPTELMRYLCRLVTPPGGVVLDPFMGSGSTGRAALLEGFRFIGCELSPEYMAIARARIIDVLDIA